MQMRLRGENMPVVYLVVPCLNEEAALPETNRRLTQKLDSLIKSGKADAKTVFSMWTTAVKIKHGN